IRSCPRIRKGRSDLRGSQRSSRYGGSTGGAIDWTWNSFMGSHPGSVSGDGDSSRLRFRILGRTRRGVNDQRAWAVGDGLRRVLRPSFVFQQVAAARSSAIEALLLAPASNLRMIAAEQNFGNLHPAKLTRARVLGVFEQSLVRKRIV